MQKKSLILVLILLLQYNYAQIKNTLDSIVTSGRTLPLTTNKINENYILITKKQIQNSPSKTIEELISYYTSIDLKRRGIDGMQSDVSIRGGSFEQVLLLINGVRVTNPQTGHNLWNLPLDISAVNRVEIIKGPEAAKFGANAYAGVINVITTPQNQNAAQINLEAGSYGSYKIGTNVNMGKNKWKSLINGSYSASDGYRHNTDYTRKTMFYNGNYDLKEGNINVQAGFIEKKFGANGFYASPEYTEQYEEVQQSIVSLGIDKKINQWGVRAKTYWTRSQDMYLFVRDNPSVYRNMHIGNNIGAEAAFSFKHKLGVTAFGTEFRRELLQSNNLGERDRNITSLFFEHNFFFFNHKLNISPGLSWSNFSNSDDFFYPQLELGYKVDNNNKIYANAARVHRLPSYTELFYTSKTEIGNPNLKPESADSYELGYRYSRPSFSTQISLFHRYAKDAIDWVKNDADKPWSPINNTSVTTNGIDINVEKKFEGFFKNAALGYTYIDKSLKNTNFNLSRYSLENLRNQVILKLENRLYPNLTSAITYRYLDRVSLDNYSLLDARINYNLPKWRIHASLNNILNTSYTESSLVPMPGFWVNAGISYNLTF